MVRARSFWPSLIAAAILSSHVAAAEWIIRGRVIGIADGDTLTVLDGEDAQHRIRVAGIDAPERKQPFGTASKETLSRLIFDRRVEARCHKRDRFGRDVCNVYEGLRDIGLEQVRAGMAWHFKEYQHEQSSAERQTYAAAEDAARAARRGLWSEPHAMPPREWRKAERAAR
jgi:endonuclease YncB( thermonuclease family)